MKTHDVKGLLDDKKFLNIHCERKHKEEYEVSDYSMDVIHSHYPYLKNDYMFISSQEHRRQMSSPGAWLQRKGNGNWVDVVADVLTSEKFMEKKLAKSQVLEKYRRVYHSIGNILPIPEGGNDVWGRGDCYTKKLQAIRQWIEKKNKNMNLLQSQENNDVIARLDLGLYLSKAAKGRNYPCFKEQQIIRYWLQNEVLFSSWEDYVVQNYLQDFVNTKEDYKVKELQLTESGIEELIKMIICRSYRILSNGQEMPEDYLNSVITEI